MNGLLTAKAAKRLTASPKLKQIIISPATPLIVKHCRENKTSSTRYWLYTYFFASLPVFSGTRTLPLPLGVSRILLHAANGQGPKLFVSNSSMLMVGVGPSPLQPSLGGNVTHFPKCSADFFIGLAILANYTKIHSI